MGKFICEVCGKEIAHFAGLLRACADCSSRREQIIGDAKLGAAVRKAVGPIDDTKMGILQRADDCVYATSFAVLRAVIDALEAESEPVEIDGFEEAE